MELRRKPKPVDPGFNTASRCRKCSTPVTKQTSRKNPKGDFYYEYYLLCPNPACKTSYTVEEAKRLVERPPSLL